jgi:hypothetical protein
MNHRRERSRVVKAHPTSLGGRGLFSCVRSVSIKSSLIRRPHLSSVGTVVGRAISPGAHKVAPRSAVSWWRRASTACFWFNTATILEAGYSMCDRYVYERFLPELSAGRQRSELVWFTLFNGKCIGVLYDGKILGGVNDSASCKYFRKTDARLLARVCEIAGGPYVIAVVGQGTRSSEIIW